MESEGMIFDEIRREELRRFCDLQRIYKANKGVENEELSMQLKQSKVALESMGINVDGLLEIPMEAFA